MIGSLIRPQDDQLQGDALVERMQMRMTQRDQKTPAFLAYYKDVMDTKGYPTKTMEEYGFQPTLSGLLEQANPMSGAQTPPSTPNTESFFQVTPPSVPVSEQTPLPGLPPSNNFVDDTRDKTLPQISDPAGLQKAIRTVNPIVSGPEEFAIASNQQIPDAGLFNRVGQQLIGYDDQFSGINDRLNKIEEGIASLIQNRGQGLNMNTGGLGYFFNPFGGFYG